MQKLKSNLMTFLKRCLTVISFLSIIFTVTALYPVNALASTPADNKSHLKLSIEDLDVSINHYISERAEGTAAVSLGVYKGGEILYKKHYGYIDVENKIEAGDQSIYEWGSVSKALIWVSSMQLVESGKLNMDEDIRKYFPEEINSRLKYKNPVTMRNLMNHQSGFQEITYPVEFSEAENIVSFEELLIASEPPQVYKPGTVTAYNNWAAALAAYVVEALAEMPFHQYVKINIFSKLDMQKTAIKPDWSDNPFVQENRLNSKAYYYTVDTKESLGSSIIYIGLYPAGACAGTLDDFLKFAAEFTSSNTKLFQKQETLSQMKEATSYYSNGDERNHHGLWSIDYKSHLIGHSGNTEGFSCGFYFDPQTNTGYAVMTNEVGETAYNYGLAELLFGRYEGEIKAGEDISSIYYAKRSIVKGCARMTKYLSMILPISKTEEAGIFKLAVDPDTTFTHYGNHIYRQDTHNGLAFNIVKRAGEDYLEAYTTDMEKMPLHEITIVVVCLIGMAFIILSVIPSTILYSINRKSKKEIRGAQKINYLAQLAAICISLIFFYMWLFIKSYTPGVIVPLCIGSGVLALFLAANFVYQLYNKIRKRSKTCDIVKAALLLTPAVGVLFFQTYNFWF